MLCWVLAVGLGFVIPAHTHTLYIATHLLDCVLCTHAASRGSLHHTSLTAPSPLPAPLAPLVCRYHTRADSLAVKGAASKAGTPKDIASLVGLLFEYEGAAMLFVLLLRLGFFAPIANIEDNDERMMVRGPSSAARARLWWAPW